MKAYTEELVERDTAFAMLRSGLGIFTGTVLHEGYAKSLHDQMWGQQDLLRAAYEAATAAERIAVIAIAVVGADPTRRGKDSGAGMDPKQLIEATRNERLQQFLDFMGELSPDFADRIEQQMRCYTEQRLFHAAPL